MCITEPSQLQYEKFTPKQNSYFTVERIQTVCVCEHVVCGIYGSEVTEECNKQQYEELHNMHYSLPPT